MTRVEYRCSIKKEEGRAGRDAIAVDRVLPESKSPQGLTISFRRTIRVPDNEQISKLPPSLGYFPLYKVHDYASRLPQDMLHKGGIFFPMHQKEALWIRFKADAPFMIKIYCGGVNVVSGEHNSENAETKKRRLKLSEKGDLVQDYVVVPKQPWLDGVAVKPSIVRQFVAMPIGDGFSVEAQLTGKEVVGGLQFEITPALCTPKERSNFHVNIEYPRGKIVHLECSPEDSIGSIMSRCLEKAGIPFQQQRLLFEGEAMAGYLTLSDYDVETGSTLQLRPEQIGGGGGTVPKKNTKLGIAVGGMIKQDIRRDTYDPENWLRGFTLAISVHILNSLAFREVTGLDPPKCPIDAKTYADAGLPFFDLYEESPTDISDAEAFNTLCSVNEVEMARGRTKRPEVMVRPRITSLYERSLGTTVWDDGDVFDIKDPDGLLNPRGAKREFRTLADLEKEISDLKMTTNSK